MKKRNLLLFLGIVIIALVWGAVYWYFVVPVIDPR
ncbi:YdgA family protein [Sporosarcina aquimarina]|nr:YdgA family protein [Sporosarcina aquimarina]MCM3756827.1 YdgA family protein [Sporosarcina aquimarina]